MNHKKEETSVSRIIRYSNEIILLKMLLQRLKSDKGLRERSNAILREFDSSISPIILEIESVIKESEQKIKKLLYPLFQGKSFIGYNDDIPWSLSSDELKTGFLILNEESTNEEFVLILSEYSDRKNKFMEGELLQKRRIGNLLSNIGSNLLKPVITEYKIRRQ